jgi:hypothetical protein
MHKIIALLGLVFIDATAAHAAGNDLRTCLDVYTNLEAGADVTEKDLTSAQAACKRAQSATLQVTPSARPMLLSCRSAKSCSAAANSYLFLNSGFRFSMKAAMPSF